MLVGRQCTITTRCNRKLKVAVIARAAQSTSPGQTACSANKPYRSLRWKVGRTMPLRFCLLSRIVEKCYRNGMAMFIGNVLHEVLIPFLTCILQVVLQRMMNKLLLLNISSISAHRNQQTVVMPTQTEE